MWPFDDDEDETESPESAPAAASGPPISAMQRDRMNSYLIDKHLPQLRERAQQKFQAAQDDTAVRDAEKSASNAGALAMALEGLGQIATAGSAARGGPSVKPGHLRGITEMAESDLRAARDARERKLASARGELEGVDRDMARAKGDVEWQRSSEKYERGQRIQGEEDDPNSQVSKDYQGLAEKFGGKSGAFAGRSATELKGKLPLLEKAWEVEQRKRAAAEAAGARADARRGAQDERDLRRQEIQDNRDRAFQQRVSETRDRSTHEFSGDLEKSGIPSAVAQLQRVQSLLPAEGDVPGYGRVAGMLSDAFVTQDGEDLRQAVQTLFNIELKDRSGAAVTDQELNRLKKEFGQGTWKGDGQLRKGLEQYATRLQAITQNRLSGAPDAARQEYVRRGGRDFSDFGSVDGKGRGPSEGKSGTANAATPKGPAVGDTEDGWVFKGGDPADPNNWEKETR